MLRVLALIPGFPDHPDTWPPSLLLERLGQRVELTVATWSYPARERPYWHRQIRVVPLRRLRGPAALFQATRLARPDVVHAFWVLQPGLLGALLGARWRVPMVVSALGGEVVDLPELGFGSAGSPWLSSLARLSLRQADLVVAGSQSQLQACWRFARLRRTQLLPVGVHERFLPLPRRPPVGQVRLLAVGSLLPVKRVAWAIEAVAQLGEGFHLEIAGDGPLREQLETHVATLGVADRIHFLGQIEGEALLAALGRAHLLVHASAHEGSAVALLEALATGLPIVATAVGAAPELLADGAGVLAEASPGGIADAIQRAAGSWEAIHRPGAERMSKLVRSQWSVNAVAGALVESYRSLTGRGGAPPDGGQG